MLFIDFLLVNRSVGAGSRSIVRGRLEWVIDLPLLMPATPSPGIVPC